MTLKCVTPESAPWQILILILLVCMIALAHAEYNRGFSDAAFKGIYVANEICNQADWKPETCATLDKSIDEKMMKRSK